MAARFAVVSGRSNGRGKCENLQKIAFRTRQKATKYGLWSIFCENRHEKFLKNISGKILNFNFLFERKLASPQRDTEPRTYVNKLFCSENIHKEFLQIFFLK